MKKQLLTLALLLVGAMANAQISKGDIQLTGGLRTNSQDLPGGAELTNFNFTPQAGLFLSETTSLGLILGYTSRDLTGMETTNFNYGIYARFHKQVVDNFYLFIQPSLSLSSGEADQLGGGTSDISGYQFNAGFGMTYFFSPKFAVEIQPGNIGFGQSTTTTNGTEEELNNFNAGFGFNGMTVGVSFYLKKK